MAIENRQLVGSYGTRWARNKQNIRRLRAMDKLYGVYLLLDGSMPVYIGPAASAAAFDAINAAGAAASSGTTFPGTPSRTDDSRPMLRPSFSGCFLSFYGA